MGIAFFRRTLRGTISGDGLSAGGSRENVIFTGLSLPRGRVCSAADVLSME